MPLSIKDREVLEENLTLEAKEMLERTAELSAVKFLTTILRDEFKGEICVVSSFGKLHVDHTNTAGVPYFA